MTGNPYERYQKEAPAPAAATMRETIRYVFDEIQRRAWHSTEGLVDADLNHDPGHGAMTIGAILHHQLRLVRFYIYNLDPLALEDIPIPPEVGSEGDWHAAGFVAYREEVAERFRQVFAAATDGALMAKRPDLRGPEGWEEWPVAMRILRPLTDLATHVGQVNYARRRLGKPVGRG
jgi:hypothetical protein